MADVHRRRQRRLLRALPSSRRPFHCCPTYAKRTTAFNADYYGAIIRAYFDGKMPWLNDVERGTDYKAGDL